MTVSYNRILRVSVKSMVKISSIFVAFLENMNFNLKHRKRMISSILKVEQSLSHGLYLFRPECTVNAATTHNGQLKSDNRYLWPVIDFQYR